MICSVCRLFDACKTAWMTEHFEPEDEKGRRAPSEGAVGVDAVTARLNGHRALQVENSEALCNGSTAFII